MKQSLQSLILISSLITVPPRDKYPHFLIILTIWQVFDEFSEKYDKMKKILNQVEAYGGSDWKDLWSNYEEEISR